MASPFFRLTPAQEADVQAEKRALRLSMNAIRDSLSAEHRAHGAEELGRKFHDPVLRALLPPSGAVVAGYIAIRSEIDPLPLMRRLREAGYRLALPYTEGGGMVFRAYEIGDRLREGPMKTREPEATRPLIEPDLVLTPLLAFDAVGGRLGYGMGYYDRWFMQQPDVPRLGVAFACQEVARIPRAPHDVLLHSIMTES
jgi:5-formyltetrahydrofolate cyclo-ligase